jgi:triacylglycerol esterase/lipase EstA (alpha/beta hydrolase family)
MHTPRTPPIILLVVFAASLCSCGGLDLKRLSATKSYKDLRASIPAPSSPQLSSVDELLAQAARASRLNPGNAIDLYLEAAERTFSGVSGDGVEAAYYRHATGQVVALLHSKTGPRSKPSRYQVSYAEGKNLFSFDQFDSIDFADTIELEDIEAFTQKGIGAPMVCSLDNSRKRKKEHPFVHAVGISTAATALIEFPAKGKARVLLYNTRRSDHVVFRGASKRLATNFTVPMVTSAAHQGAHRVGLRGVLRPTDFINEMGLYSNEFTDPTKTPVIFTHGLASRPATWIPLYNALLAEKWFRENYQFYAFSYPTGLPPMYPAAGLKQDLEKMYRELKIRGAGNNADRVVLVGHSMGGLMTSFQIRDFRGTSNQIFSKPIVDLPITPTSRKALLTLMESPPPHFVTRAIFVATPHRGSDIANGWLGRFVSMLAKVPEQLLTFKIGEATNSLTSFGHDMIQYGNPLDGVARLKTGTPFIKFTVQCPMASWVPYHSIIGDRGEGGGKNEGDDPESSDGVVPYWSSHLEGAASEKIVPSDHSAHTHPEAIEELKRILQLHLQR